MLDDFKDIDFFDWFDWTLAGKDIPPAPTVDFEAAAREHRRIGDIDLARLGGRKTVLIVAGLAVLAYAIYRK